MNRPLINPVQAKQKCCTHNMCPVQTLGIRKRDVQSPPKICCVTKGKLSDPVTKSSTKTAHLDVLVKVATCKLA